MQAPDFDRHAALLQQRELLRRKAQHLSDVLDLIEKTLANIDPSGQEINTMNTQQMFEVFPDMKQEYQDEAQERWGNTEAWKQSATRWKKYTKADLERMKQEMAQVYGHLEKVFAAGTRPDAPTAIAAIDAQRLLFNRWFYDCSKELHAKVTEWTSSDERFVRNLDKNCPGLAAWMHQAARANLAGA
jgi:Asp-tRNA(Asn)/Glu-tRNA(Gln) amidotransferase C subunit